MTAAARAFLDAVRAAWDSRDPWAQTARKGLCDVDEGALRALCEESGEDFAAAEAEVLAHVRAKVADPNED